MTHNIFLAIGWIGQFFFGTRFVVQWLYSEYKKESRIPIVFWYLSLIGSALLLTYSIYRRDPIFIVGFSLNSVIYIRNLVLISKKAR